MISPHEEQPLNLGFAFGQVAEDGGDFPALISDGLVISYAQLWHLVRVLAARMQERGIGQDSLVALNTTSMPLSLGVLLATALLGARFVEAGQILAQSGVLQPTHFLRSPEVRGSDRVQFEVIEDSWLARPGEDPDPARFPGYADPDAPWMYLHTSGSTGAPKYIALSQRMVHGRTMAVAPDFPRGAVTFATLFGVTSRPFYARALGALLHLGAIVEGTDPAFWRQAGVNLVFASPAQLARFLEINPIAPRIARVEVSGAALSDEHARLFSQHFVEVIDVYGASETSKSFANRVDVSPEGEVTRTGQKLDSSVEIVTDNGLPCAPGQIGAVRVRNPYMTQGYIAHPEASARLFRDGWFHPGDIAVWGARGELTVMGRDDDMINLGGQKVMGLVVDFLLTTVPGIKDAVCFKNPKPGAANELLAFAVFDGTVEVGRATVEAMDVCKRRLGVVLAPRNIRPITEVPRDAAGRPLRAVCQQLLLERYLAHD